MRLTLGSPTALPTSSFRSLALCLHSPHRDADAAAATGIGGRRHGAPARSPLSAPPLWGAQTEAVGEAEDLGRVCGHLEAMRRGTDVLGAE